MIKFIQIVIWSALMKKLLRVTKVTRLLKIADILRDMLDDLSDEDLLDKYKLSWKQMQKIYSKLYYGGYLTQNALIRRMELRAGKDASHIPFAEIHGSNTVYQCEICGFSSSRHFSACPRCRQVNLRRLKRRVHSVPVRAVRQTQMILT